MVSELITKCRSYRRFESTRKISREELLMMVDAARRSGSTANLQRLRFALVNDNEECDKIFENLAFAGYLKEWKGPKYEERPTAYIIIMTEKTPDVNVGVDMGIAAEAILLVATEIGLGGCMIRSFKKSEIDAILGVEGLSTELVIALGAPSETVYLVDAKDGDIKYYRDEKDNHAVPKLSLSELVVR